MRTFSHIFGERKISSSRKMDVLQLPPDVFRLTLDSLSIDEILRLCQLNKAFQKRICQDQNVWKYLYRTRLSSRLPSDLADWKAPFLALPKTPLARFLYALRMGYERLLASMRPREYWIDAATRRFGPDSAENFKAGELHAYGKWVRAPPQGEVGYLESMLSYEPPDLASWPHPVSSEENVPIGIREKQRKARQDILEIVAELKEEIRRRSKKDSERKDYVLRGNHGYELGRAAEPSESGQAIRVIQEEDGETRIEFPNRNRYAAFLDMLNYLEKHLWSTADIFPAYTSRGLQITLQNFVPIDDKWADALIDYVLKSFFDESAGPFEVEVWSDASEDDSD